MISSNMNRPATLVMIGVSITTLFLAACSSHDNVPNQKRTSRTQSVQPAPPAQAMPSNPPAQNPEQVYSLLPVGKWQRFTDGSSISVKSAQMVAGSKAVDKLTKKKGVKAISVDIVIKNKSNAPITLTDYKTVVLKDGKIDSTIPPRIIGKNPPPQIKPEESFKWNDVIVVGKDVAEPQVGIQHQNNTVAFGGGKDNDR